MNGFVIRQFLRELFGSQLNARLEEDLLRLRADYDTRLLERDQVIAEQRERLARQDAKLAEWEMVLIPLVSPVGSLLKPKRERPPFESISEPDPNSWPEIQRSWYLKQEAEKEVPVTDKEN